MTYERLLAKSLSGNTSHPSGSELLTGHTMLVVQAAEALLELRGRPSLRAAGLPEELCERLKKIVLLGAFVHDLGKANNQFLEMVLRKRTAPQILRHEVLSLCLCAPGQALHSWLRPAVQSDNDYILAILSAVGHHRKFPKDALASEDAGAGTKLTLLIGHDDFAALLRLGSARFGLATPPALMNQELEMTRQARSAIQRNLNQWKSDWIGRLRSAPQDAKLLAIAKALVLDADVAGSVLPRAGEKTAWIATQFRNRADELRLHGIATKRLGGKEPRHFQLAVAASGAPVTLVRAGCGSGKTVAAYLWAAQQHPGRQLWMTYPTTGTTTEGYRDYLFDTDIEGYLDHSRADVDLDIFGLREGDPLRDRDRLDAIRAWGAEVVTCTVDTVLGLIQNNRKGVYAWAALADSAVVFDEIHAYDDRLFGSLLRFLEALPGIPALLVTASLPKARLDAVEAIVQKTHGRSLEILEGPKELEALPRYAKRDAADPWVAVKECMRGGGKVLWVNNTVKRCMDTAACADHGLIYHSRFRYIDRVERHGDVIDAFKTAGAALAITTQVAEMSLDLSADLLVTDLAPIPALIQRLGRLNRRATRDDPGTPRDFIVLPASGKPYEEAQYAEAAAWLDRLGVEALSQRDLVEAWTQGASGEIAPVASAWLDGGFETRAEPVREGEFGVTVLRESDAPSAAKSARDALKLALPMGVPKGGAWKTWKFVRGYPVAPDDVISYDPLRGGEWR